VVIFLVVKLERLILKKRRLEEKIDENHSTVEQKGLDFFDNWFF
jgi:hypothetical protein